MPNVVIRRDAGRVSASAARRIAGAMMVLVGEALCIPPADVKVADRRLRKSSPRGVSLQIEIKPDDGGNKNLCGKVTEILSALMSGMYIPAGVGAVLVFPGGKLCCQNGFGHSWTNRVDTSDDEN